MQIDAQTLRDLEIFRTDDGVPALFDRLDRTVTRGGREALRRRFQRALADASSIQSVQDAISFLMQHPNLLEVRPRDEELLPLVAHLESRYATAARGGGLRGSCEYVAIRLRYKDMYEAAVRGVRATQQTLLRICDFADVLGRHESAAELKAMLGRVRALLTDPEIAELMPPAVQRVRGPEALRLDALARDRCADRLHDILRQVYEIDALMAMAAATRERGYTLPAIAKDSVTLIEGVYHPFIQGPVPNDFAPAPHVKLLFLTGPNMAGKTTYLKACGCAVYLAHLGMGVPAHAMKLSPYAALFTSLRVADSLNLGVSYFQAEARRVKAAAQLLVEDTCAFILLDEVFKGTNVKDALDASALVLNAFSRSRRGTVVVSSHLVELADVFADNQHIVFRAFHAELHDGVPVFDYRIRDGVSAQRLGTIVLEREGVTQLLGRLSERDA
jgi:DNA mismatch repair protein MutS